jgi:hypothetical protein
LGGAILPTVDGAVARFRDPSNWVNRVLGGVGPIRGTYTVGVGDLGGAGYPVKKYGATTGLTNGFVTRIDYSGTRDDEWVFRDQLYIDNNGGTFQQGGDSGSVVVDAQQRIVGLLWGGVNNPSSSFVGVGMASPIEAVETGLQVKVVTSLKVGGIQTGSGFFFTAANNGNMGYQSAAITTTARAFRSHPNRCYVDR